MGRRPAPPSTVDGGTVQRTAPHPYLVIWCDAHGNACAGLPLHAGVDCRQNAWTGRQAATTTARRPTTLLRPNGSSTLWEEVQQWTDDACACHLSGLTRRSCSCSRLGDGLQVGATTGPGVSRGARACWAHRRPGLRSCLISGATARDSTDSCPPRQTRPDKLLAIRLATGTSCGLLIATVHPRHLTALSHSWFPASPFICADAPSWTHTCELRTPNICGFTD